MQRQDQLSTHAAQALEAHRNAKQSVRAQRGPISGDDISSLNQLLQWSTAHTNPAPAPSAAVSSASPANASQASAEVGTSGENKTTEQLATDRQWLDAAFPDIYAGLRALIPQIDARSVEARVEALESLQEYVLDMNYALNLDKLGALQPVLQAADSSDAPVRAAAVWVLGTAMKDLPEVKATCLENNIQSLLARRLADAHPHVRAKAVMAASALLRHPSPAVMRALDDAGATAALRARLADNHLQTRRRARFFLQHAPHTGNQPFVSSLLNDQTAIASFSASLADVDVTDVADVEAAVGALRVLIEYDAQGLLRVAPELPGVLDDMADRCSDDNLKEIVAETAALLA